MTNYKYILPVVMIIHCTTFAQTEHFIPRASLEDKVLGWMPTVRNFAGAGKPLKVDDKLYPQAQLALADVFATWIRASYVPQGGLGGVLVHVSDKLNVYSANDAAKPQVYGALSRTYFELKYDSNKKIVPATGSAHLWSITANAIEFGEPLMVLNTPTDFYFLMPLFGETIEDKNPDRSIRERYDLSKHPALKPYITYFNLQTFSSHYANSSNVLLCKDSKLPFVKVTKGEYLDKLAGAIGRKYTEEKTYAVQAWPQAAARAEALKNADNKYERRLAVLQGIRATYQNRLQETAEVITLQPTVLLEYDNSADVFGEKGRYSNRYPVYKVDPAAAERAKTEGPQWVLVSWNGNIATDPLAKRLHEAVLNNFDFDYLYNFVFDPEKVKGQPYKPRRSPDFTEPTVVLEASAAAKINASDTNIHFFDDFSSTVPGKPPVGWAVGIAGLVTNVDGLPGNWAVLAGDYGQLTAKGLRTPLPQNFTVSYDLVVPQNFTWGARGMTFQLASEKSAGSAEWFLRLRLRPGYDGRDGEAIIETKFPAGYLSGGKWTDATGFSNNKKNNRIAVAIRKMGDTLQVFIDTRKIAEYPKALPPDLLFNAMSFSGNNDGVNDKFYISNIKISKE
jgi:hypothetical protein